MLSNYLCQLKSRSSLRFSSNQKIVNNIIKNSWDLIHFPHHPSSVFHAAHTNIILFQSWIRLGVCKTLFKDSNQCKERIFMVTVSQLQRLLIIWTTTSWHMIVWTFSQALRKRILTKRNLHRPTHWNGVDVSKPVRFPSRQSPFLLQPEFFLHLVNSVLCPVPRIIVLNQNNFFISIHLLSCSCCLLSLHFTEDNVTTAMPPSFIIQKIECWQQKI